MITQIVSKYLESHRRLNIPGVGAFMSKEGSGDILFSELLKKDDGVLRTLLAESGLREIEVAATLDRFIFELRHATEAVGGEFMMDGFGTLVRDEGGKLTFMKSAEPEKPKELPQTEEIQEIQEIKVSHEDAAPQETQSEETPELDNVRYTPEKIKQIYFKPQSFREPDTDVDDLTYGKKQKPLNGYSYVQPRSKRGGVDKVLLFGILAAVLAVAVIAYGYYVGHIEEIHGWIDPVEEPTQDITIEDGSMGAEAPQNQIEE